VIVFGAMRPLLALLLSLTIFGAVAGYLSFARHLQEQTTRQHDDRPAPVAQGKFSVEITLSFDAGAQTAFSLDPTQAAALRVVFQGRDLLQLESPVAAGTVRVEDVPGIAAGANEFFIEAQPAALESQIARAVRVRVFRDENPVADQTLWSEPGLPVRGTVRIDVPESPSHDHT
jgi:hypothetical protein